MSSPGIATLSPGDEVDAVFACTRKDRLTARTGTTYLALQLRDRTGTIEARAFRDADLLAGRFERGQLVRVRGRVERFRDELQLDVSAIARAAGGGGHRQAAGFSTELADDELVAFLRKQVAAQL